MFRRAPWYVSVALSVTLSGCFLERAGSAGTDASSPDAAPVDSGRGDGGSVDGGGLDGGRADGGWDAGPACGNGRVDPGEQCDRTDLGGANCATYGLTDGALQCAPDCTHAVQACLGCGNGRIEVGEECDGPALGLSCTGGLACDASCTFDTSACSFPSAGDGRDGTLTITGSVDLDEDNGAPRFAVGRISGSIVALTSDPVGLGPGDEVILINMQGALSDCISVGRFETGVITSIGGRDVTLGAPIAGGYGVGESNTDLTGQKIVLQRIPHFDRLEILGSGRLQADRWDGATGGLIAFRTRVLVIESGASLDAGERGYRGGIGWSGDGSRDGRRGESICGDPQDRVTTSHYGGGGGGRFVDPGDGCGQGGGGAGHGTVGASEGYPSACVGAGAVGPAANGGEVYAAPALASILLGSGGGGGASDDHSNQSGTGGRGGGFILVWAAEAIVEGRIVASGAAGTIPSDSTDSGNGGGGSGGAVVLRAGELSGSGSIVAVGGDGPPSQNTWNSAGGDGGEGRVRVDYFTANGARLGTMLAADYVNAMATPAPGFVARYLD